jgi:hypothetical protein
MLKIIGRLIGLDRKTMTHRMPNVAGFPDADAAENLMAKELADEQRWSSRKSTVLAGTIISDQLPGTVSCVVRDLSSTGALIELRAAKTGVIANASGLPDTFALVLLRDNSEVRCEVAWRQPASIGVRFLGAFKQVPPRAKAKAAPIAKRKWF